MKFFIPSGKVAKKLYYPLINDKFDVTGTKLGWENSR